MSLSTDTPTQSTSSSNTPSDGSFGFHHHKPKLTVQIDTKTPMENIEAHKINTIEGNIVNSPNTMSDKQLEKIGKKQLKSKLLSSDSLGDEGFHMEIEALEEKKFQSISNTIHNPNIGISLDRLGSIDSMKSAGSVLEKKNEKLEIPKKCPYHNEMNVSWFCDNCKQEVCELCSMNKMAVSNPMICHHCFDERAKNWNMIWLVIGAICIGIVCPPLMVAAPLVIIMRSRNDRFKRIGWILFWVITFGIFILISSGLLVTIALKYAGKL